MVFFLKKPKKINIKETKKNMIMEIQEEKDNRRVEVGSQ